MSLRNNIMQQQEEISGTQTPGERVIIYSLGIVVELLEKILKRLK